MWKVLYHCWNQGSKLYFFCNFFLHDYINFWWQVYKQKHKAENLISINWEEFKCNVIAMWFCHVISLVIISNNIPLNLPIALTYRLVPDGSPFWYTKSHTSIVGNWFSYIALLKSPPATIPFVGKRSLHHHTLLGLISLPPLLPLLPTIIEQLVLR